MFHLAEPGPDRLFIKPELQDEPKVPFTVNLLRKVSQLKNPLLQHWHQLKHSKYQLKFRGIILEDSETFVQYGIRGGDVIILSTISPDSSQEHPSPHPSAYIVDEEEDLEDSCSGHEVDTTSEQGSQL